MSVAVVTRTHCRESFLRRAADSVLAQTRRPDVWSILNDGGPEAPVDQIAEAARAEGLNVAVTHLPASVGRSGAANAGIRACSSENILLLDDDDTLLSDGLERLCTALDAAPESDVGAAGQIWQVEEALNPDNSWQETTRQIVNPDPGPIRIADLAYRNFVPVNSLLFRRCAFEAVDGFDPRLPVMEDWDFLLKLIQIGDIGKIDVPVAEYFIRPSLENTENPESNSVSADRALHMEWDARLRNRYLRADLDAGRFGMGVLMNPPHRLPMERINMAANYINAAGKKNWIARRMLRWARGR